MSALIEIALLFEQTPVSWLLVIVTLALALPGFYLVQVLIDQEG